MAEIIATQKLILAKKKTDRKEKTADQEATEANLQNMKPNPATMEYLEFPTEEATVKSSGTMKK
jgi:hypothetical protein